MARTCVPAELDDLLGTLVHLHLTPVLDAQPHGGVADARVDAALQPAGVGSGADFLAGHLEVAAGVALQIAQRDLGGDVGPEVERARLVGPAGRGSGRRRSVSAR